MATTTGLPDAIRTLAAGTRDVAFAAMGASLLFARSSEPRREAIESSEPIVIGAR